MLDVVRPPGGETVRTWTTHVRLLPPPVGHHRAHFKQTEYQDDSYSNLVGEIESSVADQPGEITSASPCERERIRDAAGMRLSNSDL